MSIIRLHIDEASLLIYMNRKHLFNLVLVVTIMTREQRSFIPRIMLTQSLHEGRVLSWTRRITTTFFTLARHEC